MTAMVSPLQSFNVTFHRTVTNVGFANSTYKATTFTKSEVKIIVEPEVLSFTSVNEKSSFVVHFTGGQGILPTNYSRRPHHWYGLMAVIVFHLDLATILRYPPRSRRDLVISGEIERKSKAPMRSEDCCRLLGSN
ncbi:subtilisin-like protease sbt4.3 [Quercus suber]|uniref:Subtilisin-like protease sbt4.3 n=1 Tax=Quercus suber TaxID=58331 RepID=A0AAW0JI15_QUESU